MSGGAVIRSHRVGDEGTRKFTMGGDIELS